MNRIGLKVNGIWCVLPDDVSISIEEQNPLFSDSGSFSYPIEMSVSQNRELFGSIDSPQGCIRPQDLDGLPFELWYDGVMILYGSTETDEDLDIEDDKCSINLVSGNGDFQAKIEGMQCTDVPLLDEFYIGDYYPGFSLEARDEDSSIRPFVHYDIPLEPSNNMDYKNWNVTDPYPLKPYCNIRVCLKRKGKDDYWESPYQVVDADRPWSGVCFYVAYFFKCLYSYLGYFVKDDHLCDVEDMKRLAFVTTKCEHRLGEKEPIGAITELKVGKYIHAWLEFDDVDRNIKEAYRQKVYATEKNFPETDISNLIESMFNAFGLKIVVNDKENTLSVYYIRDILRDNEVINTDVKVIESSVAYEKTEGVKLTYGGDEKDTAFNYTDYKGDIKVVSSYLDLSRTTLSAFDKTLYVSSATGNKYRIKIDEEAEEEGDVKNLNPVLFEVAQFNDYVLGEDTENTVELPISFTPLIENDSRSKYSLMNETSQLLSLYIDTVEVNDPGRVSVRQLNGTVKSFIFTHTFWIDLCQDRKINFSEEQSENPITAHDCGFMLGVMRGGGNHSGYAVQLENYDGNGNDAWVTVEDDYAFTADSIDAYGNHYDYNGTAEGGVADQENSISLKPHIHTAKEVGLDTDWGIEATASKRGLADRFMSEYMHFLLHRKTVSMSVDTTLSQLTALSWFKQLRIGDTVGRLKSRKYTLSNKGVSGLSVELYTIN